MILGRVCGSVVSTIHHRVVDGQRLLVIDRLAADTSAGEGYLIAFDAIGAGYGETVLVLDEGNGARQILDDPQAPVRSIVVGIVDQIA
jgi:microcompartment protein CcmK/EutM